MGVKLSADASQFKREMDAAAASVKALASESKLADSELRKTGDAQTYVEQKTAALTRQIEAQQRAVSAAERGLAEAAKAYGQNSQQAQQWQTRLNQARTALNNFEANLNEVRAGTDRMQAGLKGAATDTRQLGQIADATRFTAFKGALDSVSAKMNQVSSTAQRVARSIWSMATDSAQWADDLATNARRMGIDQRTLQQWEYAAHFVDVEASTIAGASNRLLSAMRSDSAALGELGVSARNNAGALRSTQDVFWETVEALGRMTDETERDAMAQQLFGRSFQDLIPLIESGRQAWEDYCAEAERAGLVLTDEQIANLTSFNDSLDRMRASATALKHGLMAELAPGFEAISDTVGEAVQSILEWTRTAEGQEAINSLTTAVQNLVHSMADGGLQALIHGITDAITALGHAADWAAEHSDSLMSILALVMGGSGVGRVAIGGLRIANGVRNLFGIGAGAAGTGAAGSAAAGTGAATAATGAGASGALGAAATGALGFTAGVASLAGMAYMFREMGTVNHGNSLTAAQEVAARRLAASGGTGQHVSEAEANAAWRRQQQRLAEEEAENAAAFNEAVQELVQGWRESHQQEEISGTTTWRAREQAAWTRSITQEDITEAIERARIAWSTSGSDSEGGTPTQIQVDVGVTGEAISVGLDDGTLSLHEYNAIVDYVREHLTPAIAEARALIGAGWGEVVEAMYTPPTADEWAAAMPGTERGALEYFALTGWVKENVDQDLEDALAMARDVWVTLISAAGNPEALNVSLAAMTGEEAAAANDETFNAMVTWVQTTMGVDRDRAIELAKQMWDEMRQAACNPGDLDGEYHFEGDGGTSTAFQEAAKDIFGEDYEAAMAMIAGWQRDLTNAASGGMEAKGYTPGGGLNPNSGSPLLARDIARLEEIRAQLEQTLAQYGEAFTRDAILSLDIPDEEKAFLLRLIDEGNRIAGNISWYESDEAKQGAGAYALAMQGEDVETNMPTALAYLDAMRQHELDTVDAEIGALQAAADEAYANYQRVYAEAMAAEQAAADAEGRDFDIDNVNASEAVQEAEAAADEARAAAEAAAAGRDALRASIIEAYTAKVTDLLNTILIRDYGYTGFARPGEAPPAFERTPWQEFIEQMIAGGREIPALGYTIDPETGDWVPDYGTGAPVTAAALTGKYNPETGEIMFPEHTAPGSAWYDEADSVAAKLKEVFGDFDTMLAQMEGGDWWESMLQTIINGGPNAGLYDQIMSSAFGNAWADYMIRMTNRQSGSLASAGTDFAWTEGEGYHDLILRAILGAAGLDESGHSTDATAAGRTAAAYNDLIALYNAMMEQLEAEAAAAYEEDHGEEERETYDAAKGFIDALVAAGAINPNFIKLTGGDYGPYENLASENFGFGLGGQWSEDNQYYGDGITFGDNLTSGAVAGIEEGAGDMADAASEAAEGAIEAMEDAAEIESPSHVTQRIGRYMMEGLALGISENEGLAVSAAAAAARAAEEAMRGALGIHSPSTVMEALGAYVGEGFAIGIAGAIGQVQAAVGGLAAGAAGAAARGGNSYNSSSAIYVDRFYNNSGEDIAYIGEQLAGMQRRQQRGLGYGR